MSNHRSIYNTLDFIGDVGGLFDGLKVIGYFLVAPFSGYTFVSTLIESIFMKHTNNHEHNRRNRQPFSVNSVEKVCLDA